MKIRIGFVSNSSSSSYIILLPNSFNSDIDLAPSFRKFNNATDDDVRQGITQLMEQEEYWAEEDYDVFDALLEMLKPYVIGSIDTGPSSGVITLANRKKIEEILLNEK